MPCGEVHQLRDTGRNCVPVSEIQGWDVMGRSVAKARQFSLDSHHRIDTLVSASVSFERSERAFLSIPESLSRQRLFFVSRPSIDPPSAYTPSRPRTIYI